LVSSTLLDGMAERERVRRFTVGPDGTIEALSVEDMIADRVGQYASGSARDRIDQVRALFALFPDLDCAYLERRIRYESAGDHGLEILSH